jgi:hypothetical protein
MNYFNAELDLSCGADERIAARSSLPVTEGLHFAKPVHWHRHQTGYNRNTS